MKMCWGVMKWCVRGCVPQNQTALWSRRTAQWRTAQWQTSDRLVGHKTLGFSEELTDKLNTKGRGNLPTLWVEEISPFLTWEPWVLSTAICCLYGLPPSHPKYGVILCQVKDYVFPLVRALSVHFCTVWSSRLAAQTWFKTCNYHVVG